MEKQISKDPDKVYKYDLFIEILQNKLVLKEIRQVNVSNRYLAVKQRNNQSVAELISHLNSLKEQLNFEIQDKMRRMILLEACHNYLKQALILKNQLGTTRLELEEALRSIKGVKTAPPGIIVKRAFRAINIDSGPSRFSTICQLGNNSRRGQSEDRNPYTNTKRQRQLRLRSRSKDKGSHPKCQYCAKTNHLAKDCFFRKSKKKLTKSFTSANKKQGNLRGQ